MAFLCVLSWTFIGIVCGKEICSKVTEYKITLKIKRFMKLQIDVIEPFDRIIAVRWLFFLIY